MNDWEWALVITAAVIAACMIEEKIHQWRIHRHYKRGWEETDDTDAGDSDEGW